MGADLVTTNATPTKLASFLFATLPHAERGVVAFELVVLAQSDSGVAATFFVRGAARFSAGVSALVGVPAVTAFAEPSASTWAVSLDQSGDEFRLWVTGGAGVTVTWDLQRAETMLTATTRGGIGWSRTPQPLP